ncbi:MAG: glycosyltransferase [Bernardetiaceae bacterium]|nr:glycosyltransferase [Bernardetiaceae bacterium]
MPTVTVMMPAYNAEKYIAEAIESILNQSFQDFELLVLDDGSTDKTQEIVTAYQKQNAKIKFIQNPENKGLSYTRNRLLAEAKGKYLAILDSDDIALPSRLEKQVNYLEQNPKVGLLGTGVIYVDAEGKEQSVNVRLHDNKRIPCRLLFQNVMGQSTIMMRQAMKRFTYSMEYLTAEDYQLWVRMSYHTEIANLSEPLIRYRQHDQNISVARQALNSEYLQKIHCYQLAKLGIEPSEAQLKTHRQLSKRDDKVNSAFLATSLDWLWQLHQAQQAQNLYDTKAWGEELRFRAMLLITEALDEGRAVAEILDKHPLLPHLFTHFERWKYRQLALSKDSQPPLLTQTLYRLYKKLT